MHAVLGHRSITDSTLDCDLYLLEGDPAAVTRAARAAAPYGAGTDVVLDAPFRLIVPFDYALRRRDPGELVAPDHRLKESGEAVRTIAITGSGSGMGAALAARLEAAGDRVIGIDVKNAEVEADLGTAEGRASAIERVSELSGGTLDGLVTLAGLAGPARTPGVVADLGQLLRHRRAARRPASPARPGHRSGGGGDQLQLDHLPARARRGAHRQLPRGRRSRDACPRR